ncbi:hypothetical protein, partial [Candidatus Aquicultor secundus]|uniref:hypothetical protein n=1 Tax=Candidatus Aquicultor secundus TaxID=1973895 RepID=UPI0025801873
FDDICKNISKDNLEVLHIKENQHNIKYSKFDKYISGWIFHLFNKPEQKLELDDYVVVQNDIKSLIAKSFIKTLKKYNLLNYVNWVNITTENQPVILTKNTFLTTLPQGWITSLHNGDYLDVDLVRFENKLTSTSYGSAKHIMTNKIK